MKTNLMLADLVEVHSDERYILLCNFEPRALRCRTGRDYLMLMISKSDRIDCASAATTAFRTLLLTFWQMVIWVISSGVSVSQNEVGKHVASFGGIVSELVTIKR